MCQKQSFVTKKSKKIQQTDEAAAQNIATFFLVKTMPLDMPEVQRIYLFLQFLNDESQVTTVVGSNFQFRDPQA